MPDMDDPDAELKARLTKEEYRPSHRIRSLTVDDRWLTAKLRDGRILMVPLSFYPALRDANPEDRAHCHVLGEGFAISWPTLDYDMSADMLVHGAREGQWYAAWRKSHPLGPEHVCDFHWDHAPRTSHRPRRTKRVATLSSAALPGRRKRKPAASRTKSVTSRTRKSGLKTKR
jgi:hypothetical protein